MGWIRKTKAGTWRAGYRDPSGTCKYQTFKRKVEAERYLSTVEADIMRGNYIDPTLGRMRLRKWAEKWWPTTLHLRPTSGHKRVKPSTTADTRGTWEIGRPGLRNEVRCRVPLSGRGSPAVSGPAPSDRYRASGHPE